MNKRNFLKLGLLAPWLLVETISTAADNPDVIYHRIFERLDKQSNQWIRCKMKDMHAGDTIRYTGRCINTVTGEESKSDDDSMRAGSVYHIKSEPVKRPTENLGVSYWVEEYDYAHESDDKIQTQAIT